MNGLAALAPITIVAASAIAVMIGIAIRRNFNLAFGIAAVGLIAALWSLSGSDWDNTVQATPLLRIDTYALFFIALLLAAGLAVLGLSYDYFKHRESQNEELPLLVLTALLGASVLAASSHFASFFIGLEILSISLIVLVAYPADQARPLEAAIKYLVLSGTSSAFLLMGMALVYAQCGELYFDRIGGYITSRQDINGMVLTGAVLIIAGLGFKLSLAPFHLWTPDVYQGAPAPVSALIATVSKSAVFAVLLRFFISAYQYDYTPLMAVLSVIAALSILGGNLLALLQTSVKRLLAYSSIAHMGYLLVPFIAGGRIDTGLMVEAVGFYLLAYVLTTIGAFGVVSMLSTPRREADDIVDYRGLFGRRPWLAAIFTLMLLSLAGIPLTVGFIGKFYIFTGAADGQLWGLLGTVIVGSGLGLYYYLRIIATMLAIGETAGVPPAPNRLTAAILAGSAFLLVGLGVYPGPLIEAVKAMAYGMG
ncbi:MAG: NADH-quinone oxidoreductase subunit N [Methylobacter sp.]